MKRRYPKLINLLVENEESKEIIVFDEDDPAMQVKGGNAVGRFFKNLRTKLKRKPKKPTLNLKDDPSMQITGDSDPDVPTLNFPEDEIAGNPIDAVYQDLRSVYDFRLGNLVGDAQKIVGKQKPSFSGGTDFSDKAITFLVTKNGGVFMRTPGEAGFEKLEGEYSNLSEHIIKLYKEIGGEMLNEGLSRGSLYRKRYYGRY